MAAGEDARKCQTARPQFSGKLGILNQRVAVSRIGCAALGCSAHFPLRSFLSGSSRSLRVSDFRGTFTLRRFYFKDISSDMKNNMILGAVLTALFIFSPVAANAQGAPAGRVPVGPAPTISQYYALTPQQQGKMKALASAAQLQVDKIKNNPSLSIRAKVQKIGQIMTTLDNREVAILTPEQKKKRDQLKKRDETYNYLQLNNQQKIASILISEKYRPLLVGIAKNPKLSIDAKAQKIYQLLKQRNDEVAQYYTPAQRAKSKAAEAKVPASALIAQIKAELQQQNTKPIRPK